MNTAWLKAAGDYVIDDKLVRDMVSKITFGLKDGEPVLTLVEEGQKADTYLDIVNESEAVIKGYGRNSKETVFLTNEGGKYSITMQGVKATKK